MKSSCRNKILNISITFFCVIIGLIVLELIADVIWWKKYDQLLSSQLHGFDHVDYERHIIVPNPNTNRTVESHRLNMMEHGKIIGLKNFEESIQGNIPPDSVVLFSINKYGFKGPEITLSKPDSVVRILTIGNSCTWGPANDYYSYPRTMERELNQLISKKEKIEVINAGVKGYNYEAVLKRIDDFLLVDPDLITIYLGWNRTIFRADPSKNLYLYRRFSLYKIFYHFFINKRDTGFDEEFAEKTFYDKNDPYIKSLEKYSFKYDIEDLNILIDIIHKKDERIKIKVITLAGLFDWRITPDTRSLDVGYSIASTFNLYGNSLLTKKYNDALRKYVSKKKQVQIIDFDTYALNNFIPRSKYFSDSVHFTNNGYLKLGEFLVSELIKDIPLKFSFNHGK